MTETDQIVIISCDRYIKVIDRRDPPDTHRPPQDWPMGLWYPCREFRLMPDEVNREESPVNLQVAPLTSLEEWDRCRYSALYLKNHVWYMGRTLGVKALPHVTFFAEAVQCTQDVWVRYHIAHHKEQELCDVIARLPEFRDMEQLAKPVGQSTAWSDTDKERCLQFRLSRANRLLAFFDGNLFMLAQVFCYVYWRLTQGFPTGRKQAVPKDKVYEHWYQRNEKYLSNSYYSRRGATFTDPHQILPKNYQEIDFVSTIYRNILRYTGDAVHDNPALGYFYKGPIGKYLFLPYPDQWQRFSSAVITLKAWPLYPLLQRSFGSHIRGIKDADYSDVRSVGGQYTLLLNLSARARLEQEIDADDYGARPEYAEPRNFAVEHSPRKELPKLELRLGTLRN